MKKRILASVLLALSIALLATSCKKEDPANGSIVGSWKIVYAQCDEELFGLFSVGAVWTFEEDGALSIVEGGKTTNLKYTRSGKEVAIEDYITLTISSLNSSNLSLRFSVEKIDVLKVTFKKITHV